MDNARRWLTQIIGRGNPDPPPEPTARAVEITVEADLAAMRQPAKIGMTIPSRAEVGGPATDPLIHLFRHDGRGDAYSWSRRAERFVALAHQLVDISAPPADRVPFQAYWSTYDDMNLAQRRWYFWWRQEYRAGRALETDLSYIFVYVYELLNLVGARGGEDAFDQLSALDAAYAARHPSLPNYLDAWTEDLAVVHGLAERLDRRWSAQLADANNRRFSSRMLHHYISRGFLRMPMPVIGALAHYDVNGSFARAGNKHLLELFVRLALDAVDSAHRERTGKGLVDRLAPQEGELGSDAFRGAVYAGKRNDVARVPDYRYADRLAERLHGVIKYTEKRLRDETDFKHRLRSYEITKTDAKIVDRIIAEQLPRYLTAFGPAKGRGRSAPPPEPEPVKVSVDSGRVRELITESDETRRLLIEAMATEGDGVERKPGPVITVVDPGPMQVSIGFGPAQVAALRALLDDPRPDAAIRAIAAGVGLLPEMLLDSINEASDDALGDAVIDLTGPTPRLYDEYAAAIGELVREVRPSA